MDLGIESRVALVTASSKGIGKATALQLSREGADVALCARHEDVLLNTRDEIAAATGGNVKAYQADVTDRAQVKDMIQMTEKELGSISILVCNAGGPPPGLAEDFSIDDYRSAVELNLLSTVNLCYEVVPSMKRKGWGRVIIINSVSVKQPIDTLILSNTARAGALGFAKSLSNQLAPRGITVNSICPGYTKTERVEGLARAYEESGKGALEDYYENIERSIPLGRLGRPEEIAQAVAFLASEIAGYITGVALQVDGGYVKSLF